MIFGLPTEAGNKRRDQIYDLIEQYIDEHGFPPSLRDIGTKLHMSTSNVSWHLDVLEKDGRIQRQRNVSRGIRLVR